MIFPVMLICGFAAVGIEAELWRVIHDLLPHHLGVTAHFILIISFWALGTALGATMHSASVSEWRSRP